MRARALLAGAFVLLIVAGCGGSSTERPAERAGDLREAHDQIEGELLLNEVEEWATEYAIAKEGGDRRGEDKALREVQRAAYGCWEFGIEECSEILKVESTVEALEEEAHRKIPFTHPPASTSS
jgi:hypothetical protein